MDTCVQIFKFYNLGSSLERDEIIKCIEAIGLKELEQYDFSPEIAEPEYIKYPEPIVFSPHETFSWQGTEVNIKGKIYTYGALSLKVKLPLPVASENLEILHNYVAEESPEARTAEVLDRIYYKIVEQLNSNVKENLITNFNHTYQVFCLSNTDYSNVTKMAEENRNQIASLLSGIYHQREFSDEYLDNVLYHQIRLYRDDFTIIHWNNALIIDNQAEFVDKLFIIELANIQFIKLQVYDQFIDNYLSNYIKDVSRSFSKKFIHFLPGVRSQINEISRIRVELEEMTDIMDNFEKFFGRWYLAKIYYLASHALEIKRWRNLVSSRMSTVNELYSLLNEDINRNRMLFLNILMLLLFILWFVS